MSGAASAATAGLRSGGPLLRCRAASLRLPAAAAAAGTCGSTGGHVEAGTRPRQKKG